MRSCIALKDANAEKFVANGHYSFTFVLSFVFTFSVVVVDLPTDCILSFLFPAETDVLVPVFSQSTDVVVVNFVVVLKFPIVTSAKVKSGKLGTGSRVWSFRALSSRQLTLQLNQPNYIDRDDVIRTTTALHDFSFIFQVRFLQFKVIP